MKDRWKKSWSDHALLIAQMSPCPRGRVGAVLVDERNNPVSMGFNGPPEASRETYVEEPSVRGTLSRSPRGARPSSAVIMQKRTP